MAELKKHSTTAAVAMVAGLLAAGGTHLAIPNEKIVEKPVHVTVATSKHAWPDLSDAQVDALATKVGWLKGTKISIFCDGADCRDLQTDLDNAFEMAGVESQRVVPMNPLGYGLAVLLPADDARGQRLADAIKEASAGKLVPTIERGAASDAIYIVIGKRPRR